jgi:hypothetical protein
MVNKFVITTGGILLLGVISLFYYLRINNRIIKNNLSQNSILIQDTVTNETDDKTQVEEYSDAKSYVFDVFHGSKNISKKFKFLYPSSWQNDGQYFSPEKIEYYDLYSVKAPVYFDLIKVDIFDQTEFKYQIDKSKRRIKDSVVKIDGDDFKKYDLIDYGSYGGESAGRVIVYVGPKISVDSVSYYLVFHFEERPLTSTVPGNDPSIFEKIVLSLKFIE